MRTVAEMLKHVNAMTADEFQTDSMEFQTPEREIAVAKAHEYNERGVRGHTIVAVRIEKNYCVMLDTAAECMVGFGVVDIVT